MYSMVPEEEPGGGGYAVMIETLGSLWEDFQHLKNIWTASNVGLPLVRFMGGTLIFFQDEYTDYIVEVTTCPPMKDFKYTHADIAPNRALSKRNVIRVPSLRTRRKRKPYKRKHINPPAQLENKWYFQKDVCDIPFVMIKATAVDFKHSYGDPRWQSNNLTLICINTAFIHRHDFKGFAAGIGWFPKADTYLYITKSNQQPSATSQNTEQFIYLGNTKDNKGGKFKNYQQLKSSSITDWGNPFYHDNLEDHITIWAASTPPSGLPNTIDNNTFRKVDEPLFIRVRYNPEKDTGKNNQIYLLSNTVNTGWDPPQNENLVMSGFPLYDMIWGYLDWEEKIHEAQQILQNYMVAIRTDFFSEKLFAYVPVDIEFIEGFSAYKGPDSKIKVTDYDQHWWHPRTKNQLVTLNKLGLSGPGCARPPSDNYLQAQMKYIFRFKWGGCPKTLENPYDPCQQPTWTIPSNLNEGLQIENPSTNPETQIQKFDWRRDYVKESAISRIKEYTDTDELLQIFTDSKHNVRPYKKKATSSETDSETEETEASLQTQIKHLRKQQRLLKQRILQQLNLQNTE